MSYIILYFSIGLILVIIVYLYCCYDYKINRNYLSWEQYSEIYEINLIFGLIALFYPFYILILIFLCLQWCFMYVVEYVREHIFKIIDKYFVK